MRKRLRPKYSEEQLKSVYPAVYDHRRWSDHILRVQVTAALGKYLPHESVADLSCGDGSIAREIGSPTTILGDFVDGYEYCGPIEQTITQIPHVQLFVCSETLEHLDDPDVVLAQIRSKSDYLLLSTPIDEDNDSNPEHYWGWGVEAVRSMILAAGFNPFLFNSLNFDLPGHYYFQIWGCS
mgnify:CR=1 FL=1